MPGVKATQIYMRGPEMMCTYTSTVLRPYIYLTISIFVLKNQLIYGNLNATGWKGLSEEWIHGAGNLRRKHNEMGRTIRRRT